MFEFLSKLVSRRPSLPTVTPIAAELLQQAQISDARQKTIEQERQQYIQKISASINDQASLLDLLSACDFADGRYMAAQHIVSQEYLEKALQISRKVDKRVAKLMQMRLDEIRQQQSLHQKVQACMQQADHLLAQPSVLANQLVELEKQFAQLAALPAELSNSFEEKRQSLQARLNAQIDLQRQFLQLANEIDQTQDLSSVDGEAVSQGWNQSMHVLLASPFLSAVPKVLLRDVQQKLVDFDMAWKASQETKRCSQNPQIVELDAPTNSQSTGVVDQADIVSEELIDIPKSKSEAKVSPKSNLNTAQIEELLSRFEAALAKGSAQAARQFEKELRDIDTKRHDQHVQLSDSVKDRLNVARKELSHLMSWAKWSGAVSRDELISTAEKLATLSLSPQEIVDTVSALRDQWKQMEGSGSAPKELWQRFDLACKAAYAPAAAYFQLQSELRKENVTKAEATIHQFNEEAERLLNTLNDWKMLRAKIIDMQQIWRKIGQVDRKDKTRLDKEFERVVSSLRTPLEQRQQEEIQSREKMIEEALSLDALQKSSQDQLRSLQQRWQLQASKVPLQRKDEQKLWERFRAACDGVFEKRRQLAESADQQRESNLAAKQAICQAMAATNSLEKHVLRQAIDHANTSWREIGHVPRTHEANIEKEFQGQLQRLQKAITQIQTDEVQAQVKKVHSGLVICQQLDAEIIASNLSAEASSRFVEEWQKLALPASGLAKVLTTRFERAIKLTENEVAQYQQESVRNADQSDALLLHLEILLGIENDAVSSQVRLKKQVEVLQSTLRSGDNQSQQLALLAQLVSLPVGPNEIRERRLQKVITCINPA